MRLYPWLAGLLVGALAVSTGCGGGGGGSSSGQSGNVSVLIKDAPLLAIAGTGRTFSKLNVDILSFEASTTGSRAFTMNLVNGPAQVDLLSLSTDQDWLAVGQLPVGRYDTFRLTIDTATAALVEDVTNVVQPLTMHQNNSNGILEFHLRPPLEVTPSTLTSTSQHLVLVDWDAHHSVTFAHNPTPTGTYYLAGNFSASAVNRQAAPLSFRSLPGRLTAVDAATGEMRIKLERNNQATYLVRTNPTSATPAVLETMTGSALTINDFASGDFVTITGTVDGNTDIDATRVRKLPASNAVPPGGPGGGHNGNNSNGSGHGGNNGGPGNGGPGNGGPGNPGPVAQVVFAVGEVSQLDLGTNTFVLGTPRGQINVTYTDSTGSTPTPILDATVRPPQPTSENGLSTPANGTVIVEVVGRFVAPATANTLPTIDATRAGGLPGRIVIIRRQ